ncbi:MAG: DNA cytosine methyltransferase, partial [Chthonomonadales bacterium]|nr:DNA cytosine methyltransferase [Chthonomonadales bacterium]
MNYLSVCSGIEAATVAWHPLGWHPVAFSEIEPFPCAVLKHHYPDVPNLGDMTKYKEWNVEQPVDLVVGGTPCQSFSVAGLRKGLDDPRGNLALVFLGLVDHLRPRWVVWENVPGVLSSSGGRDFGSFLGALEELGYGFAYRVLDAQYFGVAQRRRRVFVVGHLGDWRPAAAVLFESHSLSGHPAPRREKGKGTTHDVAPSIGASCRGFERAGETRGQDPVVVHALTSRHDSSEDGTGRGLPIIIAPTLGDRPHGTDVDTRESFGVSHTLGTNNGRKQAVAYGGGNTSGEIPVATDCNCKGPTRLDFDTETFVFKSFDWQSGGDSRGLDL